ncbi:hypothetical protein IWQ61_002859 [Dispira simplex]|nr:hypothetical protein IWQ61_002859 [Dispira simplex]
MTRMQSNSRETKPKGRRKKGCVTAGGQARASFPKDTLPSTFTLKPPANMGRRTLQPPTSQHSPATEVAVPIISSSATTPDRPSQASALTTGDLEKSITHAWSHQFFGDPDVQSRYETMRYTYGSPTARESSGEAPVVSPNIPFPSPLNLPNITPSSLPRNTSDEPVRGMGAPCRLWYTYKERWFSSWATFCQHVLPIIILLLTVAISIVVFFVFKSRSEERFRQDFEWRCRERSSALVNDFKSSLQDAQGYAALLNSVKTVTPSLSNQFSYYTLAKSNLFGVSYSPIVKNGDRKIFEESHHVSITDFDGDSFETSDDADEYSPVLMTYPDEGITPIGYDLFSDPTRQQAMKGAQLELSHVMSQPISLFKTVNNVTSPLPDLGYTVIYPVFDNEALRNEDSGTNTVIGFVSADYRIQTSFNKFLEEFQPESIRTLIWDKSAKAEPVYDSYNLTKERDWSDVFVDINYTVLNRNWTIRGVASEQFVSATVDTISVVFLVVMNLFGLTLAFILRTLARNFFKARRTVQTQHVELGKSHAIKTLFSQQSQATLQAVADPLLALDCEGYIIGANSYVLTLTGYSRSELFGQGQGDVPHRKTHIRDLLVSLDAHNFDEPCAFHHGARSVRAGMLEVWVLQRDGSRFEAEANFSQVIGDTHPQCLQVVVFRDITESKADKRAILEAKRNAERANQSKGAFLAFLCHEIRNPAHVILGYAEMLRSTLGPSSTEVLEDLQCIETAAQFMGVVVSDVLDLTHMTETQQRNIQLHNDVDHFTSFVQRCVKLQQKLARERQVMMDCQVDSRIPPYLVFDRYRLSQALMKLIIYAIEDSKPRDTVFVNVELRSRMPSTGRAMLRFTIQVPGATFSSDNINGSQGNMLDQPFDLEHNSLGAKFFSAGVSKALALTIIRIMGGHLEMTDREAEQGTQCFFDLEFDIPDASERDRFLSERTSQDSLKIQTLRDSDAISVVSPDICVRLRSAEDHLSPEHSTTSPITGQGGNGPPLFPESGNRAEQHPSNASFPNVVLTQDPLSAMVSSGNNGSPAIPESVPCPRSISDHTPYPSIGKVVPEDDAMRARRTVQTGPTDMTYDLDLDHPVWRMPQDYRDRVRQSLRRRSVWTSVQHHPTQLPTRMQSPKRSLRDLSNEVRRSIPSMIMPSTEPSPEKALRSSSASVSSLPNLDRRLCTEDFGRLSIGPSNPLEEKFAATLSRGIPDAIMTPHNENGVPTCATYLPSRTNTASPPSSASTPCKASSSLTVDTMNFKASTVTPQIGTISTPQTSALTLRDTPSDTIPSATSSQDSRATTAQSARTKLKNLRKRAPVTTASSSAKSPSVTPPPSLVPSHLMGQRVLLVEDNLICQRVTAKMLKKNGFQVDIANHGKEAVEMAEDVLRQHTEQMNSPCLASPLGTPTDNPYHTLVKEYACIVMDVVMPVMDGCEASRAIAALGYEGPIIALTANSIEVERQRCLDAGMAAFVTKPVKEKDLIALVCTEIQRHAS